jgi:threonine aldolase
MVYFSFRDGPERAARAVERLKARGVLFLPPRGATVRAVTHLDVTEADVDEAARVLREEMR